MFRADIAAGVNGTCGTPVPQVVERRDPSEKPGAAAGLEEGGGLSEGQRVITDQTELPPKSEL